MRCPPVWSSISSRMIVALFVMLFPLLLVQLWYHRDILDDLRRQVLAFQAQDLTFGRSSEEVKNIPFVWGQSTFYYTLYTPEGTLLWYAPHGGRPRRFKDSLLQDGYANRVWFSHYAGREVSAAVELVDGNILIVSKRDDREREALDSLLDSRTLKGVFFASAGGVVVIGLMFFLFRWTTYPLRRAARMARNIGPAHPEKRLPVQQLPYELHELAKATNEALDRLCEACEREKNFVSYAAHQLRTPLSVTVLLLEEGRKSGQPEWELINGQIRQMERMVFQLGRLFRSDRGAEFTNKGMPRLNVSRQVRECAAALLPLFEKQNRILEADLEDGLFCRTMESGHLHEILGNLLENALMHGKGKVLLKGFRRDGLIVLDVSDEGEGVSEKDRERVFERFCKADPNSEGSGLGLSIARSIARNGQGDLFVYSTYPCIFRLEIPFNY